jgi:lysophospholipid acyltransferase (LPLAT)-like uncharacterized protein
MHPLSERLALSLVPRLATTYVRLLGRTMRLEYRHRERMERFDRGGEHYILAFWHSRFLMMPYAYFGKRITIMVSRHRDAEMLVRTLQPFGYEFARGSTTRGGSSALRDLLRRAAGGSDAAIAPDGPRGPRRRVQAGIIAVARLSGLPILPVTCSAWPARRLGTWDRTVLPRPFSRGVFDYAEPIRVPRHADRDEQESLRRTLEAVLDGITDQVDRDTGLGAEEPRPAESRGNAA